MKRRLNTPHERLVRQAEVRAERLDAVRARLDRAEAAATEASARVALSLDRRARRDAVRQMRGAF